MDMRNVALPPYIILFYFILFYFILFYFILFYFILFYFILFYFIYLFIYLLSSNGHIFMVLVLVNDNNPDLCKLRFHLKLQRRHVRLLGSSFTSIN